MIGLHFAWDFSEGGIYGMPVSGLNFPGLLKAEVSGPELITGGAFGSETSIIAILICFAAAVIFLVAAQRRGRFVQRPSKRV